MQNTCIEPYQIRPFFITNLFEWHTNENCYVYVCSLFVCPSRDFFKRMDTSPLSKKGCNFPLYLTLIKTHEIRACCRAFGSWTVKIFFGDLGLSWHGIEPRHLAHEEGTCDLYTCIPNFEMTLLRNVFILLQDHVF